MAELTVSITQDGAAYVSLVPGEAPEVRTSVGLEELEEAEALPALESIVLDFDYYGRLVGLRVTSSADSVLAPSLLENGTPAD